MGMDFIATSLWQRSGTILNFEAGHEAARGLDDEACKEFVDQAGPWDELPEYDEDEDLTEETRTAIRQQVAKLVDQLAKVESPGSDPRDLIVLESPDGQWRLWIAGGSSWGDSPGETFDAINNLWICPAILGAIGFETA